MAEAAPAVATTTERIIGGNGCYSGKRQLRRELWISAARTAWMIDLRNCAPAHRLAMVIREVYPKEAGT